MEGDNIMKQKTTVVIGGGPAGMIAAATAGALGKHVILFEKNTLKDQVLLGKKLLITGNGRCNITNDTDSNGLIANVPTNGRFLYSAFEAFSPQDTIGLLKKYGVETKTEGRGRVFPASNKSKDIVEAFRKYIIDNGVKIQQGEITSLSLIERRQFIIDRKEGKSLVADSVIVATGGMSYPQTGSTGDGYRFAEQLGHTITPLKGALVPLEANEQWAKGLQGLSLSKIKIQVMELTNEHTMDEGKNVFEETGDILFTHFGITGPLVFSASSHIDEEKHRYKLYIDLLPECSESDIEKHLLDEIKLNGKKQISSLLQNRLPKRIVPIILQFANVSLERQANEITQRERKSIVTFVKRLPLTIKALRSLNEATVTSGGIKVKEINPKTMESKIVKGLYFAGEIIDVNGYTGGFNIQIALSTGYVAGTYS